MAFLVGTDEAGYGPPLGPLVISATAWECPQRSVDLYKILADVVSVSQKSAKVGKSGTAKPRLLIADSKVACRSGAIRDLETTVLLLLQHVYGRIPRTLPELVAIVMPTCADDFLEQHFWLNGLDLELPIEVPSAALEELGSELEPRFRSACQGNAIRLSSIRSTILLPPEFNAEVIELGNKATLLSNRTLQLAAALVESRSDDVLIECDKHGGRSYYHEMIANALTDLPVEIVTESPKQSVYQWSLPNRQCEVRFTAKGEGQLPVALASMVSKYVREVFMVAWNDYWSLQVPNIKPTKGDPQDAKRFLREIQDAVAKLQLSEADFWRSC